METADGYSFKPGRYSSHSVLLGALPEQGGGHRLLDVGCAGGYLSEILAQRGYRVTGLDRPGTSISGFPANVRLVEADLEEGLPKLDGRFMYAVCADILEHLRNPGRLLRDVREYLEPNGRLVASLPNSGNFYFRFNILLGRFPQDDKGLFDRTHLRFYMWKGWQRLFEENGFEIDLVRPTAVPVGLAFPALSRVAEALEAVSYGCARAWMKLFAYQFVVVARKKAVAK